MASEKLKMSKSISLTNYNLRCMMGQLPDELGIVGAKIVYDTGLVVEVNKINDQQLFISGLNNSSDNEVAKTVKL